MKYIDEFRQRDLALKLAEAIAAEALPSRRYNLMEFCGGHTHAIFRYGVQDLMPENVRFVHGPGCPVCVLPIGRIDNAIELVERHGVILCTYGDMLRVPASGRRSLIKVRAEGGDVRMVYSTLDALRIARDNPGRQVVFFAIGFETTTPPTAVALQQAQAEGLTNFSVFCNHVLTPPAIRAILAAPGSDDVRNAPSPCRSAFRPTTSTRSGQACRAEARPTDLPTSEEEDGLSIDGILGPSHVSSVIGSRPYEVFAETFGIPIVIAGFEPLDVMQSVRMLIRQLNEGRHSVENEYTRAVTRDGNRKAQALMAEVLELRETFEWRGLGVLPQSALRIREPFAVFDAERRFELTPSPAQDVKGCECPAILRGTKRPTDCKLFGAVCTPENPMGACMVSSEGSCAAYWTYGRVRGASAA
ncbi:MAG: hydrogenase formation protein HypD [Gammaproteobacteria bacterium]|nr:hydrogenase formation protein HypD [Gammaproteobacteria bacterium]MBU1656052.1 hydrogenase formation protein HypD [Gammaproteobacteria bacterium]MBU1962711.1 hydrogenase formation protein HypD [Gammaproteobacteria bacterium]